MVESDRRGKHKQANKILEATKDIIRSHISKYPEYESHYSKKRTSKNTCFFLIKKIYYLYTIKKIPTR